MKRHFYTYLYVFTFLTAASIPGKIAAQCNCSDGTPANKIEYVVVLNPTMSSSNVISFPKFDPSIGDLACIDLFDTISIVTRSRARNMDTTSAHEPTFRLTVSPSITGPGVSLGHLTDVVYGPDSIQVYGAPGDSLVYGPDTVYDKFGQYKSITNYAPYYGTGNVNLNFSITGGMISIGDGFNYQYAVGNYTWGTFRLVYNWCPASLLARNITSFTAIKKDHNIQLHWSVNNEEATNIYEIQISYDGQHFVRIGQTGSQHAGEGTTAEYDYEHVLKQTAAGKLYFRIQQKDLQGKTSYSSIRVVNVDANGPADIVIYPNPVRQRSVSLQFDRIMNGQFAVDVVNAGGQVLFQRVIKANNTNLLSLELTDRISPGVYYLRARDMATQQTWLNKLLIQ